jgi:hypothetical protein
MSRELVLALTYEELIDAVASDLSRLTDLVSPVPEFERQIIQIVQDIRGSGYLLFLHGVSGTGKSTFLSSLRWREHIPIREIINVKAPDFYTTDTSKRLKSLYLYLAEIAHEAKESPKNRPDARTCIVIDYLESLSDEDTNDIRAFFRDLNALLRSAPVLIVWPVTNKDDVKYMQEAAESFSSTMFHRRIPVMEFTGPPIDTYANIAKKTISILNGGASYHDFQLTEADFETSTAYIREQLLSKRTIREYLQSIKDIWEDRVDTVSKIRGKIPGATEVWFVVCYPEAESVVAQFARRSQTNVVDNWNADYSKLSEYTSGNQREAEWKSSTVTHDRLALALTGVLTTKIMFMPTNTFVHCATAYAEECGVPISRKIFEDSGIPSHWFQKSPASQTLRTSPLYLQLVGEGSGKGFRKGGPSPAAIEKAKLAFENINKNIASPQGSDEPYNRAMAMALENALKNKKVNWRISPETLHPFLNVKPDILVETDDNRFICIEFHYTTNAQPNQLARYCLDKLNTYMKQIEHSRKRLL